MTLNEQLAELKSRNIAKHPKDGTIACADVDADYTRRTEPSGVVAVLNFFKTKKERN